MQYIDIRILGYRKYQLLGDLHVETSKYKIMLATGMIFNGADIPEAFWSLIGCPLDFALEAAVHDALYRSRVLGRKDSDEVFYELMQQQGVDSIKARKMYLGVRIGGANAYEEGMNTMAEYRDYIKVEVI